MKRITYVIKTYISIFLITIFSGCVNKQNDRTIGEDKKVDSIFDKTEEKVQEVNEGVKEGFEKSKDEIKKGIEKINSDSV